MSDRDSAGCPDGESLRAVRPPAAPAEALTAGSVPDEIADYPPALRDHPRYRVLALLGKGGMGAVFKAEHKRTGRTVAIKVINPALTSKPAIVERFQREVKAAARLAHPNIVAAHDAEQAGDTQLLVMEFVEGTDLAQLAAERGRLSVGQACDDGIPCLCESCLNARGRLSVGEACDCIRQAARGLQHAHERGMVHCGIKPHNLMRTSDGVIKIREFGLARWAAEVGAMGDVDYMAPEQAVSSPDADERSDVYALGCTLYFLLAGRSPFPDGTLMRKGMSHAERVPTPLAELRADLPAGLVDVLHMMTARSPDHRFQSAEQVVEALAPFVAPPPSQTAPPQTAPPQISRSQTPFGNAVRETPVSRPAPAQDGRPNRSLGARPLAASSFAEAGAPTGDGARVVEARRNREPTPPRPGRRRLAFWIIGLLVEFGLGAVAVGVIVYRNRTDAPPPGKPGLLYSIPYQDDERHSPAHIYQTGFSSDGRLFFGAGDTGPSGRIRVWDAATGKQVQALVPGGDRWFTNAEFLPGGKYLVVSYAYDKDLYLWEIAAAKVKLKFVGHTGHMPGHVVSPDGKRLLSWAGDQTMRLWDVETGKELWKVEGLAGDATGAFSPDGKQVLAFSIGKTPELYDAATGKPLKPLEGHTGAGAGCFSPDGKQALSYGPDGAIRLWDLGTGKEVRQLEGPTDKVSFAGFVAGGRLVVGRCDDGKFRVWEAATGQLVHETDCKMYGVEVQGACVSPDGRLVLVSHHDDNSVRVLDLSTGNEICRYDSCPSAKCWSFSPDGTLAVAGSFRAGMYVVRLPSAQPANP